MGCTNSFLEVARDSESDEYVEKMTHISADITEKIIRKTKKPIEPRKINFSSRQCSQEQQVEPIQDFPLVNIILDEDDENIPKSIHSSDIP